MIYEQLQKDNIQALKDKNQLARKVLTVVFGKCKKESIDSGLQGKSLDDVLCTKIISKTIKEMEEEIKAFEKAGRADTVSELTKQLEIIKVYLPEMLSEARIKEEIEKLEDKKIPSVMKHFKTNFNGLVDMSLVSKIAKEYQ